MKSTKVVRHIVTTLHREILSNSRISILELRQRTSHSCVNFFEDIAHAVAKFPVWIMRLEFSHVANPPDVVADAIGFLVVPV